ncbi:MAG: hypothetical protein U5K30_07995 [Acidimicrobiales bacterium]|nr:hypothetical protein [Acidimicrobiales bacterium]
MSDQVEHDTTSWEELHGQTVARLDAAGLDNTTTEARWIVERAAGSRTAWSPGVRSPCARTITGD